MRNLILLMTLLISISGFAQKLKTENVILITLDGMRWQDVYSGADSLLVDDSGYVEDPEGLTNQYWNEDPTVRREILMPFIWSTIVKNGQLYGNRTLGNKVNCSNQMWFSYPGYNEILTGAADDERITSNSKLPNPNTTVLEFLNKQKAFKGKVYAFGSWDVFPYIINEERSGVPVNAGFEKEVGDISEKEKTLNELQDEMRSPWGSVRYDAFTHHYALECLKNDKPRALFISYGETDDYAHEGEYDQYLLSATQTDDYIKEIWEYVQSDTNYKDKTTLIITTDHGRGTMPKDTWRSHGTSIKGADQIWIAVIGPDTPASGEMYDDKQYYQNQVARTITSLLGLKYDQSKAGETIAEAIR
ncbi:MAG: sulfatase-like hydrolase/transferase [Bacteroidota bacterium]